ncbi:hypothetical protein DFP74_1796 [Nocardiopsis sp. Huas11]|uniref:hypothetical protein n=1 Tax=Nocardiopsis sp. Huas11 TaxID=2183912 RepID=UPI000EAFDBA7|nr:hypothetical protein [Nocardiopsis sp. Huas11]RKS06172.1 hypothetical protein DFP74_1796 [Nocardiopsis sp. Huas11]
MSNPARTRRITLGLVAAGSALALAACSGAEEPPPAETTADPFEEAMEEEAAEVDTADFNQGPIPDAAPELDTSGLPPEPGSDAPLGDRIAWEALEQVATFAKVNDPDATYECPEIAGEEGESVTCTVTFLGEPFEYTITIESSGILINYQAELHDGPLIREVVEDALRYSENTEHVLCDMDADLVRGETDTDAPFTCQSLDEASGTVSEHTLSISMYGAFSFFPA